MRTDLPRILELLARFTSDPLAADRIMRLHARRTGRLVDRRGAAPPEDRRHRVADARRRRCLTFRPATRSRCPTSDPSACDVDVSTPAPNCGASRRATPAEWTWDGFPTARYRFDPESGAFRTRYAASTLIGAFRERYRPTGLVIPADHADHHLVRLVAARHLRVFDLRTEANLDVLGVDDQISTGQHPDVWATCHRLADAVNRGGPNPTPGCGGLPAAHHTGNLDQLRLLRSRPVHHASHGRWPSATTSSPISSCATASPSTGTSAARLSTGGPHLRTGCSSDLDDRETASAIEGGEVVVLGDDGQRPRSGDGRDPQIVDPDSAAGLGQVDT